MAEAGDDLSEWQLLGDTPLTADWIPKKGHYRLRILKDGFARTEWTLSGRDTLEVELHPLGEVPAGMVWVPPLDARVPPPVVARPVSLPGFWIDTHEVTNREFKTFVDAGGYRKQEFWTQPFIKDWTDVVMARRDRRFSRRHEPARSRAMAVGNPCRGRGRFARERHQLV